MPASSHRRGRLEVGVDPPTDGAPLGFLRGANGELHAPFPRVTVRIDGDDIDMLLDTGATVELTGAAQQVLKRPRFGASSFVVDSIFDRWHRDHHPGRSSPTPAPPVALSSRSPRSGSKPPQWRRAGSNGAGTPTSTLNVHLDRSTHPRRRGCQWYRDPRVVIDYPDALVAVT